jgi:galactoside O-acetyltransferase
MKERPYLHDTSLYYPSDPDIMSEQLGYMELMYDFNQTRPCQQELRQKLLKQMLAEIGEDCYIEPPLHANWGGHHLHLGNKVYVNFSLTVVDDTHIYVGDCTKIGPNVTIATAGHPILPRLRRKQYQYNAPVRIGSNCWIGAGAVILPGVTIGDNTVIGAGSVVTRDIPANVVAVGNPCKVLRPIGQRDEETYFQGRKIDKSLL